MKSQKSIGAALVLVLGSVFIMACSQLGDSSGAENGDSWVVEYVNVDESKITTEDGSSRIGRGHYVLDTQYNYTVTENEQNPLPEVMPHVVKILSPTDNHVVHSQYVNVAWTIDGETQNLLTQQSLSKGPNIIVRYFRDRFGDMAGDSVLVIVKDSKEMELISFDTTAIISEKQVQGYYADYPPKKGETFAVSIRNPSTQKEKEVLIGGDLDLTDKSYRGILNPVHLGPTFSFIVNVPNIAGARGLATLDDLFTSDSMISKVGMDNENALKISAREYIEQYCEATTIPNDPSIFNLFSAKLNVDISVYRERNGLNHYSFSLDLDNPEYVDEAGLLQVVFELKPDMDGKLQMADGNVYKDGSYNCEMNVELKSRLRCNLPPFDNSSAYRKQGSITRSEADFEESFNLKSTK